MDRIPHRVSSDANDHQLPTDLVSCNEGRGHRKRNWNKGGVIHGVSCLPGTALLSPAVPA